MCLQVLQLCVYPEGHSHMYHENCTLASVKTLHPSQPGQTQGHPHQPEASMCFADSATPRRAPDKGHVVNHPGEGATRRVYFCQICGKTFKGLDQLCGHVRQPQGVEEVQVHRVWLQVQAVSPPMTDAGLSPTAVQAGPWSLKIR